MGLTRYEKIKLMANGIFPAQVSREWKKVKIEQPDDFKQVDAWIDDWLKRKEKRRWHEKGYYEARARTLAELKFRSHICANCGVSTNGGEICGDCITLASDQRDGYYYHLLNP